MLGAEQDAQSTDRMLGADSLRLVLLTLPYVVQ